MKKSLKKIIAGVGAIAMLTTAMPITSAFAEETVPEQPTFSVREVTEGVVITDYADITAEKIVIPSEIDGKTVVGIDNFAFGLVSQEVNIVVPATLTLDNIDDEAFMTMAVVNNEIIAASDATTINGVVKYWVNDFSGMNYNDEQIAEAISKAIAHIGSVEVAGLNLEQLAIKVVKEIQAGNCGFSQANLNRLDLALAAIPYGLVTLEGPADTDAQLYTTGKINLKYNVASAYELGDINMDGKITLQDAVDLSLANMGMATLTEEQKALADVDGNGSVGLQDVVEIAIIVMNNYM